MEGRFDQIIGLIMIIIIIVIIMIKEIQAYKNKDLTAHNIPKQNNFGSNNY